MPSARMHTVYVSCLNAVLQAATTSDAGRLKLLDDAGINPAILSIPDERVPLAQYLTLFDLARKHTADPDLGLKVGRVTYFLGLNLQLYMTTICRDLRQYLNVIPSTINLRGDLGRVLISSEREFIRLEWHPLHASIASMRLLTDEILRSSALIVGSICTQPVPVVAANFNYPRPADASSLEAAFGSKLRFGCELSCLYFPRESLHYSLISLDYELGREFTAIPLSLFENSVDTADPFLADLRSAMLRTLPRGELTIDKLSDEIGVSRRTLQRRLTAKNSSFKELLQKLREDLSLRYLTDSRFGITEIAFLLGYSDQASFSNAFRSWRNCSPSEYRNQHISRKQA